MGIGERVRGYHETRPFDAWATAVTVLLALYAALYASFPDARKPGLVGLGIVYALASPTVSLVRHALAAEAADRPMPRGQARAIGVTALVAALWSISALLTLLFGKRIPFGMSKDLWLPLLFSFSVALLLAVVLGGITRHTRAGRLGFRIGVGWFCVLCLAALAGGVVGSLRGGFR